jgi:Cu+-exporting ATPase
VILHDPQEFKAESGAGVLATVEKRKVVIGNARWLIRNKIEVSEEVKTIMGKIQEKGDIAVVAAIDGQVAAIIAISDSPRREASLVVRTLQQMGLRVYMVTGDNQRSAAAVGRHLGIHADNIISEVKPAEKKEAVERVQRGEVGVAKGALVMFVGDGINDSPALAQADVGVAIGKGTDIAVETAGVVLMRDDLTDVITAIDLSKTTLQRIRWNFSWAMVYNIIAIPLAAGVFYPFIHMTLPPVVAAIAMGCSSISVVMSSLWLKGYKKPILDADEIAAEDATTGVARLPKGPSKKGFTKLSTHDDDSMELSEVKIDSIAPVSNC